MISHVEIGSVPARDRFVVVLAVVRGGDAGWPLGSSGVVVLLAVQRMGRVGRMMMCWACRSAQLSVRMTLAAQAAEAPVGNRVIAGTSSRGRASEGSNVILTDTRSRDPAAHRRSIPVFCAALAECRG